METFELWSYDVKGLGELSEYAEHTYLKCPEKNAFFDCWGGHESETQGPGVHRFSAEGLYDVANCYRNSIGDIKDTAGIGVYGVNGVCHQTANLFLFSTGKTITLADGVKGYGISSLAYGVYGDVAPFVESAQSVFLSAWKLMTYSPCYKRFVQDGGNAGANLFQELRKLHKDITKEDLKVSVHELIHNEAAVLVRHAFPDFDTDKFKDIHLDFLKEKSGLFRTGLKGRALAEKLNGLAAQFQQSLNERIGDEAYEKLTGLKKGQTINLIDPDIAARAVR